MGKYLRKKEVKSCGCLNRQCAEGPANLRHGYSPQFAQKRVYRIWVGMRQRCSNPKATKWKYYGGRGISVCERWQVFENFLADMGEPPPGTSIHRRDNDGNYEPSNCCWATPMEQASNSRRNRFITFGGETMNLTAWAKKLGIDATTLHARLESWPLEEALTTGPLTQAEAATRFQTRNARK
jgi:hypothetical protein